MSANVPYKSLRVQIRTNEDNVIFAEIYGNQNMIYAYSQQLGQTWHPDSFENRNDTPDGFNKIGVGVHDKIQELKSLEYNYDAIDLIMKIFKDGDSVFIRCDNGYRTYNDKPQKRLNISMIARADDIDFTKENFEEESNFSQEIVFESIGYSPENRGYKEVYGYVITDKNENFEKTSFLLNPKADQAVTDYLESCKFGDLIKIEGKVLNKTIYGDYIEENNQTAGVKMIGGKSHYERQQSNSDKPKRKIEGYFNGWVITNVGEIEKGKYSESDFVIENNYGDDDLPF
jgi:hypothetical protein